jgi:prolyl-tRNA synthetase
LFVFFSQLDARDNYTPGWKFNNWELKGVPVRIEVSPAPAHKRSTQQGNDEQFNLVRVCDLVARHGVCQPVVRQ